jgi:uncharacterized protein YndB with AHSA1/START domain
MTKHAKPSFQYVTYIAATPEQVWQALTDGAMTRKFWYGRRVDSDWKVGAPVTFWYDVDGADAISDTGIVLESDPPRRLSYTFHVEFIDELRDAHPSRVSFAIDPQGDDVKLTLTHDEFEAGSKVLAGVSRGWPIVLCSLKSFVETGRPLASSSPEAGAAAAAAEAAA